MKADESTPKPINVDAIARLRIRTHLRAGDVAPVPTSTPVEPAPPPPVVVKKKNVQ